MLCRKRIIPNPKQPKLETYCMREWDHEGKCSIHTHPNICHLCKPEVNFISADLLNQHVKDVHRVFKG
jgi:hypothetical protein